MNLSQFTLHEVVGRGGMGVVHRATWENPGTDVEVAIKLLDGIQQTDQRNAFLREARAAARVTHPKVVTLLDAGIDEGVPYLVMEWLRGETLAKEPPKSWPELQQAISDLLDALACAHAWGVLHRDLKPANIMRTHDGRHVLLDFGVGRLLDEQGRGSQPNRIVGTPNYMAPEQILRRWSAEGPQTDIYGVGALVWRLACGKPLFSGSTADVLSAHVERQLPDFEPQFEVPGGLNGWLRIALQKSPQDRFPSAASASQALQMLEKPRGQTGRYPALVRKNPRVRRKRVIPTEPPTEDNLVSSPLRAAGSGLVGLREPPLLGRDEQKAALWQAFRQAVSADRPVFVDLVGPEGVGRAQLARWVARRVVQDGFGIVLEADASDSLNRRMSVERSLQRWFKVSDVAPEAAIAQTQSRLEAMGFADAEDLARDFIARCRPNSSLRRGLQRPEDWARFVSALLEAMNAPIVWLLDRPLDPVVEAELRRATLPALIVCAGETSNSRSNIEVRVEPLADDELRAVVRSVLPLEPALVDHLVDKAEGYPVSAIQFLVDWVQRGVLSPGPVGYRADFDDVRNTPTTAKEVWRRRVDAALDGSRRRHDSMFALQLLALLGRQAPLRRWMTCCDAAGVADPVDAIEPFAAAGLVRAGVRDVSLEHGLLRDTLLDVMSSSRGLHLAVVAALEQEPSTPQGLERQAYHLEQAGDDAAAWERLYASIVAYDEGEDQDAVLFLVPSFIDKAEDLGRLRTLETADALVRLARLKRRRGGEHASNDELGRALEIIEANRDENRLLEAPDAWNRVFSWALIGVAHAHEQDDPETALDLNLRALRLARAGDCLHQRAIAATQAGDCLRSLGREEDARRLLLEEIRSQELAALPPRVTIVVQFQLVDMFEISMEYQRAISALEVAQRAAVLIGDAAEIQYGWARRALLHLFAGETDDALVSARNAHELSLKRRMGEPEARLTLHMCEAFVDGAASVFQDMERLLPIIEDERFMRAWDEASLLFTWAAISAGRFHLATEVFEGRVIMPPNTEATILLNEIAHAGDHEVCRKAARQLVEVADLLPARFLRS